VTRSRPLIPIALGIALGVVALTACAPGPNVAASVGAGTPAGFWLGLWQGLICPITFFVSLFNDHVSIYEVHNNGNWYDFGYVLGISIAFGGAWRGSRVPRRSRRP
jgi:polyferredoxin